MKLKTNFFAKQVFGRHLVFAYSLLFIFVFVLTGFFLDQRLQKEVLNQLKESLLDQARYISFSYPSDKLDSRKQAELQQLTRDISIDQRTRVTIILFDGRVLADSHRSFEELIRMDNHADRPEVQRALKGTDASVTRFSRTLGKHMLYVAIPVYAENVVKGAVRVALPLDAVNEIKTSMRHPVAVCFLLGLGAVLLLGFILGYSISKRVSRISEAAIRFTQGNLDRKISVGGDDELTYLADTMNRMAQTLKKRMAETENEKAKFLLVLRNMAEGVIAVNVKSEVLLANHSAAKILEVNEDSMMGQPLWRVIRKARVGEMVQEAIQAGKVLDEEIEFLFRDKKIVKVHIAGVSQGDVAGIIVLTDMTEIRTLERMRKDFVANVSHELRTPLTSLRGFVETLLGGAMKDEKAAERFLKIMEQDANRLGRLIDDLLTLSRLDSNQEKLNIVRIHLNDEVRQILQRFETKAHEKSLKLMNRLASGPDIYVRADRDKLHQVFVNLLDNAIKFNKPNGIIEVIAEPVQKSVLIAVSDTGPGIPPEAMGRLFQRFSRVDQARSREMGGTGLGLSIVKNIVEKHGGTVRCESVWGAGAKFIFTLPAG